MIRQSVLQYLDGYNEIDLKNYLFCAKHGLRINDKLYKSKNRQLVFTDINNLLNLEKRIGKDFREITIRDLLHSDYKSMYTSICDNIFFRYFNIDLVKDIVAHSGLSVNEIMSRYCIRYNKAQGLSLFEFDEYSYLAKYEEDK